MQVLATLQYEKIRQIGVGQGMNSEVFLASDPQLNGTLAVKEVPKSNFINPVPAYFLEAQAMFAASHPNIVPIQYACETPDRVCLAMPYFSQGSLSDRLVQGPVPLLDVQKIAQGVLSGLARVHASGFLHLDIKPSNVLFSATGVPMVADFGQARFIDPTGIVQMPPMYPFGIPPETWTTSTATYQSDIYQVGLLLYRSANGDAFFQGQIPVMSELENKIVNGKFPNRDLFAPHVPKRMRTLIRKALKLSPGERYRSAVEMADELSGLEIRLNWSTQTLANGGLRWSAIRQGQPDLAVELKEQAGCWRTDVYTVRGNSRRAKGVSDYCREGLSRQEAEAHLKSVFQDLQP
jgi:serine/threonine protein kinase